MRALGTYVDVILNQRSFTTAFIDSGCLCLSTISPRAATLARATIMPISPRPLAQVVATQSPPTISQIARFSADFRGLTETLYAYVILN